ncbi:hypothetical protein GTP38_23315 [Duganella sp. FT94W]|uniref:RnfH family protein n=1 Tax=Duganella lactea TaxID=2692173 RepID=A0ABW9VEH0_9BURK|nr:hypothetical protein [Duganella lactea]MYM37260.1 hypothetical protein [Duganella lactea]
MKIQMLKSVPGSLDGIAVIDLVMGQQYDTIDSARGERLAHYHVRRGDAVFVTSAVPALPTQPTAPRRKRK